MVLAVGDWVELLAPYGAPAGRLAAAGADVVARHGEPHRHYHTLEHVEEVLVVVDRLAGRCGDLTAVRLAAWLHDVVYDPRSSANEAASARYAEEVLADLGVPEATLVRVSRLVAMTAGHRVAPGDDDGAVLADADLAILGAPPSRYRRYVAGVRAEHAWLDEETWRKGRGAVLDDLLARRPLYHHAEIRAELGERASLNLSRERAELAGGSARPAGP